MRKRSRILAAVLTAAMTLTAASAPARAESLPAPDPALDTLRSALDTLPAALFGPLIPDFRMIQFGDLDAARALHDPGAEPVEIIGRSWPVRWLGIELRELGLNWQGTVGFTPADMAQAIVVQGPPQELAAVWRLVPGAAEAVGPALAASGYVEQSKGALQAWATGEDDVIDIARRSPDDPFRGALGHSARVTIEGDLLRHASNWALMAMLAQAHAYPATADPGVMALLAGLSGLEAGPLLRATLLLRLPDGLLPNDPVAIASGQLPGSAITWRAMALADFSTGEASTSVLALVVALQADDAPELTAQIAAATLWRWMTATSSASPGTKYVDLAGGVPMVDMIAGGGDLWVLRLVLTGPTGRHAQGFDTNPGFDLLTRALTLGDLGFVPGAP